MQKQNKSYATLILAAGSSKRMGKAKLLMTYKGQTLIEKCVKTALQLKEHDTYVVTGAYQERMMEILSAFPTIKIIHNDGHLDGMGSSIANGVSEIIKTPYQGILLLLADQILVEAENLNEILNLHRLNPESIIVSNYGDSSGPPTFFPAATFTQLTELEGDKGAKNSFFQKFPNNSYDFPFGIHDIDKEEDCKKFDILD